MLEFCETELTEKVSLSLHQPHTTPWKQEREILCRLVGVLWEEAAINEHCIVY